MPRYCFFGDTINTAARMQTTSLVTISIQQFGHDKVVVSSCFLIDLKKNLDLAGKNSHF